MSMNVGYSMMSGMSGMGSSMGASGSSNNFQYFKSKYGCEDCLRNQPYFYQIPKPVMPRAMDYAKPNFLQRLLNKIFV